MYGVVRDYQPCDAKGRWLGVFNGDIACAIVDEAEQRSKQHLHWSVYGRQADTARYDELLYVFFLANHITVTTTIMLVWSSVYLPTQ